MHQVKSVEGSWSYIFLLEGYDEHVPVKGQVGQIFRIKLVDITIIKGYPLEGAHCTKLNQLDGVGAIFLYCRVEMNLSWQT